MGHVPELGREASELVPRQVEALQGHQLGYVRRYALEAVLVEVEGGEVGEGPQRRAEVPDGAADLQFGPVGPLARLAVLPRHDGVSPAWARVAWLLFFHRPGHLVKLNSFLHLQVE